MRIGDDCDRAVPTHGYFHFVIRDARCCCQVSWSWTGNTNKVFFWAVPTQWAAELTARGEAPQWSLSIKLHCSKTNISWFLSKPQNFGNVGPTGACTMIIHANFLENRGTNWKAQTKQTKSKEGQASMQAAVFWSHIGCCKSTIARVPFAKYITPRASSVQSYLSRPFG